MNWVIWFLNSSLLFLAIFFAAMSNPAFSAKKSKPMFGPYDAELSRVIDGDTVEVVAHIWPGLNKTVKVRISGINTPEKRTKNKCEKRLGLAATQFTSDFFDSHEKFSLIGVFEGKFAGRVIGRIDAAGVDLGQQLIDAGHARVYHGGKRKAWCND